MAVRIRIAMLASSLLLGAAAPVQAGEVYQWKDAKGVTHYSDAPPPKGQYQARDLRHRAVDAAPATGSEKVTTAASANCTLARSNLDRLKVGGDIGLDANGDGKPDAPLSDEARAQQTRLAENNIKTFCAPTATAATP